MNLRHIPPEIEVGTNNVRWRERIEVESTLAIITLNFQFYLYHFFLQKYI